MIVRADGYQPSNPQDTLSSEERELINRSMVVQLIEEVRREKPDLYARLQTDKRFRQLNQVKEPERSESMRWFLNEVSTYRSKPFQKSRDAFAGK